MTYKEKYHSNIAWKEKVMLLYTYHHLMKVRKKGWKMRDTASAMKISVGKASEDILIAENIDKINGCLSRNEALKRIRANVGNN